MSAPTIVVFCHLRWNFVFQRPQQLLTRLAESFQILLVEEPLFHEGGDFLHRTRVADGITVCTPHTSSLAAGFHDDQLPRVQALLAGLLPEGEQPVVWFYTPMAMPLLQGLRPALVVYDCMDELSAFKNPPRQLLQRESALLARADIVFTGGPSLFEAKRSRHANVWCFPSSVDAAHFGKARKREIDHREQRDIARPRLGFYGVIDERFDTALLDAIARARPQWQLIMVGPVVKIDPADLPRHANIHYMGQRSYQELPALLAGWDVCLMPFAINDATRFISPTKVLEYMAAELPIVSTPVRDVAVPYGDIVAIAATASDFVAACDAALAMSLSQRTAMRSGMRKIVAATSWQQTARQMTALLGQALDDNARAARDNVIGASATAQPLRSARDAGQHRPGASADAGDAASMGGRSHRQLAGNGAVINPLRNQAAMQSVPCVVVGAGPAGLSAAYHLGNGALLLERHATVGGACGSMSDKGFTFDHFGPAMFSDDPWVSRLYEKLLGSNLHWQHCDAWVYREAMCSRVGFQDALYGLPPMPGTQSVAGAVKAVAGTDVPQTAQPSAGIAIHAAESLPAALPGQDLHDVSTAAERNRAAAGAAAGAAAAAGTAHAANDIDATTAGDGPRAASVGSVAAGSSGASGSSGPRGQCGAVDNFEQLIHCAWGDDVATDFALPYNRKLWTVPLSDMDVSGLGGRAPLAQPGESDPSRLAPARRKAANTGFAYPSHGSLQAVMDGFLPYLLGKVELNANVVQLLPEEHLVALADGRRFRYNDLISTMPLPELIKLIGDDAPVAVRTAARNLRHVSIRCINIGVAREAVRKQRWIHYPEASVFHRIVVQGNATAACWPSGGYWLSCEISYSPSKPLPADGESLLARCIDDCIKVGILNKDDAIVASNQQDMPYAYVIHDRARASNVEVLQRWLARHDIKLAGDHAEWKYYDAVHPFLAGKSAADKVNRQRGITVAKA